MTCGYLYDKLCRNKCYNQRRNYCLKRGKRRVHARKWRLLPLPDVTSDHMALTSHPLTTLPVQWRQMSSRDHDVNSRRHSHVKGFRSFRARVMSEEIRWRYDHVKSGAGMPDVRSVESRSRHMDRELSLFGGMYLPVLVLFWSHPGAGLVLEPLYPIQTCRQSASDWV